MGQEPDELAKVTSVYIIVSEMSPPVYTEMWPRSFQNKTGPAAFETVSVLVWTRFHSRVEAFPNFL